MRWAWLVSCLLVTCLGLLPISPSSASSASDKPEVTFLEVQNQIALAGCGLQADGKVILAATVEGGTDVRPYRRISVSRYGADGLPDVSFGANGSALFSRPDSDIKAVALRSQGDKRIVVGGEISHNRSNDLLALRLLPNGQLDGSFNNQGWMTADLGGNHDIAHAMAVDQQGAVLLAGASLRPFWYVMTRYDFAIARIGSDGTLDAAFGSAGKSFFRIGSTSDDSGRAALVSPDNSIFFVGLSRERYFPDMTLLKLTPSGALDRRFGLLGKKIIRPSKSGGSEAFGLALQDDGKVLAGGQYWTGEQSPGVNPRALIVRLLPSGERDHEFGVGGIVDVHPANHTGSAISHIALQRDGKILAFGVATNSRRGLLITRLLPDGKSDRSFGQDGTIVHMMDGQSLSLKSLLAQSDGRILLCGEAATATEPYYPPRRTSSFLFRLKLH